MKKLKQGRLGFTLIELLVVVLIIGILSSIALPQYNKAVAKARATEIVSMRNVAEKGFKMYVLSDGPARNTEVALLHFIYPNPDIELDVSFPAWKECSGEYCNSGHFWYFMTDEGGTGSYGGFQVMDDKDYSKANFWFNSDFNWSKNAWENEMCVYMSDKGKDYCQALKSAFPNIEVRED